MDKLKQWVALTVVGCLGIMAAGWFLVVSPKRTEAAELQEQAASQVQANASLATQLEVLKARAKDLPKEQAKLAAVAAKIPDNPAMPTLIRALTSAATSTGVQLVSITPGTPALVAPEAPAAVVDPEAPEAPDAAPAAAGNPAGELASIPMSVNVVGGYFELNQFLAAVENLSRAMKVDNLAFSPGASPTDGDVGTSVEEGRSLSATIMGQVFMAANRPPATPVTVPGQAAPAAPVAAPAN